MPRNRGPSGATFMPIGNRLSEDPLGIVASLFLLVTRSTRQSARGVVGVRGGGEGRCRIGLKPTGPRDRERPACAIDRRPSASCTLRPYVTNGHVAGLPLVTRRSRSFDGTAIFICQPARSLGGARPCLPTVCSTASLRRGLCAPHSRRVPGRVSQGARRCGADFFDIRISGRGAHGAYPHKSGSTIVAAYPGASHADRRHRTPIPQGVSSRSHRSMRLGLQHHPRDGALAVTIRAFNDELPPRMVDPLNSRQESACLRSSSAVEIRDIFTVLHNHEEQMRRSRAATDCSPDNVTWMEQPRMVKRGLVRLLKGTVAMGLGAPG